MKILKWILGGCALAVGAALLLRGSKWHSQFVDATARKPSGWAGRLLYREPKPHFRSFEHVVDRLRLTADDSLLDVCCGGGSLLHIALQTVPHAAGLDHSPDMVELTRANNAEAVEARLLDVQQGDARTLPWPDGSFTAVANANALFFIPEPTRFLREVHRVLEPGGRFAISTMVDRKLARMLCQPWAPAMALYTDGELAQMLRDAGFTAVEVYSPDGFVQVAYGEKARIAG